MPRMRVVKGGADPADDLYAALPADFTQARDALVRKLRSTGQGSTASAIQHLRKPTIAVWALNQAARKGPANVRAYVDALERVRHAQLRQPNDLAPASEAMRTALGHVVGEARDALQHTGAAWTPVMIRRISETLRGVAADPAKRERLLSGRLNEEMTPPGFDVFGDARPTGKLRAVKATKKPIADDMMRRRAAELEREAKDRERDAIAAASAALEARTRLRELEAQAKKARRRASDATRTASRARRGGGKARS